MYFFVKDLLKPLRINKINKIYCLCICVASNIRTSALFIYWQYSNETKRYNVRDTNTEKEWKKRKENPFHFHLIFLMLQLLVNYLPRGMLKILLFHVNGICFVVSMICLCICQLLLLLLYTYILNILFISKFTI